MAIASSAWKRLTIVAAGSSTDPPWFRHGNALSDRGTKGSMFLARLTLFLARRSKASRMNDEPWADMARDFHRKRTGRGGWIVGTGGEPVDPRPVLNADRFNRLFTKRWLDGESFFPLRSRGNFGGKGKTMIRESMCGDGNKLNVTKIDRNTYITLVINISTHTSYDIPKIIEVFLSTFSSSSRKNKLGQATIFDAISRILKIESSSRRIIRLKMFFSFPLFLSPNQNHPYCCR